MKYLLFACLALFGFNVFVWYHIFTGNQQDLNVYFLDVGQGDAQLVEFPGGVELLVDGGPDKGILFELSGALPKTDRYIDLVAVTHPQLDHFGGLVDVVERYKVGAVLATGRDGESEAWDEFLRVLGEKGIPVVVIKAGDTIRYKESLLSVLSPDEEFLRRKEVNESSLVFGLESEGVKVLFTGDIGFETENYLTDAYEIDADVLKVPHHGSRFSTGLKFLAEATPEISVVQVGRNRFGHPTETVLSRLRQVGSSIYRNDENGTVRLQVNDGVIRISVAQK